ncbi:hypothetical protein [Streptomyces niveus]|uniref:hypothetical protein n=1 Tax=Streptomyces niveus TaxID=193462 RepID=UPI003652AFB6
MVVSSSIRSVRAAAAASATSGSRLSYTSRSITPSESNPRSSLSAAQRPTDEWSAPGTAAGSPIPIRSLCGITGITGVSGITGHPPSVGC